MNTCRRAFAWLLLGCALGLAAAPVAAQPFPSKPVKLVIPYTPGAHADLLARTLAQGLSETWGQPVVVENKPGGGGTIGTLAGSRAAPDGYTLLMTALGQLVIFPSMQATPPYNAITDFEPIAPLVRTPWVLFINGQLPVTSVQEFIAYAKAKPGELNGATPGLGTTNHLANAMLMKVAGIKAENVHYNGSAQAIQDLMAGREQFMFDSLLSLRFLGDGRLKAIAVSGPTRSPHAPELPTMIESGVSDFDVTVWFGIFAPPKTPTDIVAKVNADIQKVMASKDVQDRLAVAKFEYIFKASPAEFKDMVRRDSDKWSKVVRDIGVKAEVAAPEDAAMPLYDLHSHWGTEQYYPLRSRAQQARQIDIWKTECRFVDKAAMAAYFRKNDVRVMLDFGFTRELPMAEVRALHDEMIAFQQDNADVVLGNWLQLNPDSGRAAIDEIERCRQAGAGLVGLAVSAVGNKRPITDPSFHPFYDYCVQSRVPVMFFVGYTGVGAGMPGGSGIVLDLGHPRDVDAIAARYAKLQIIAARSAWPWQSEMIATLLHKANVWAEFHGVSPKRLTDELKREIRGRLKHKVMYANDYPMLHYEKIVGDWKEEGYPQEILERIFFRNAETFLQQLTGA